MARRPEPAPGTTTGKASGRRSGGRGVPQLASLKSILTRSAIFAVLLYILLVTVAHNPPLSALVLTAIFFLFSVPAGRFFDRVRYRQQMKKLERGKAGSASR